MWSFIFVNLCSRKIVLKDSTYYSQSPPTYFKLVHAEFSHIIVSLLWSYPFGSHRNNINKALLGSGMDTSYYMWSLYCLRSKVNGLQYRLRVVDILKCKHKKLQKAIGALNTTHGFNDWGFAVMYNRMFQVNLIQNRRNKSSVCFFILVICSWNHSFNFSSYG